MDLNGDPFPELPANSEWTRIEFISDLHLHPSGSATFQAWRDYLSNTTADAVFLLGDIFEVWVGDDATQTAAHAAPGFEALCSQILATAARHQKLFFLHGNRDFLVGPAFFAQTNMQWLNDPTVLVFCGERYLLSHGDALCLSDTDYQAFRTMVRSVNWQQEFLAKPLFERVALARDIRAQSEAKKRQKQGTDWTDLDTAAVDKWLDHAHANTFIHGHTHQPANHNLGHGRSRIVLTDWDLTASPPRAQVLRLEKPVPGALVHPLPGPMITRVDLV